MAQSPAPSDAHSQTAAEFIKEQLFLEAEAREALPYQFDTCTRPLGALRQNLFSCLTCNPPPADASAAYTPAGVCYSCSISCHGEHTLVELFGKRNFVCDCGTARLPETTPCTLRVNATTGLKGGVTGEEPARENKYNQNFRNRFCGCGEEYDPLQQKGTMFQCLGLGTVEEGGCGEDWWHPECVVGMDREEWKDRVKETKELLERINKEDADEQAAAAAISTETSTGEGIDGNDMAAQADDEDDDDDDAMLPPGFPNEDDFDSFICYKCVEAHPFIKRYAGAPGFLPPVYSNTCSSIERESFTEPASGAFRDNDEYRKRDNDEFHKRKADDIMDEEEDEDEDYALETPTTFFPSKRQKSEDPITTLSTIPETTVPETAPAPAPAPSCTLPTPTHLKQTPFSLFLRPSFRTHLCRCATCFPLLAPHTSYLLDDEETYEPPVSEAGNGAAAPASVGTGSLYDRGEAAFSAMDRVQAIQGAMAYANLKDGLKSFLAPFAESGTAVGAEDIKAYFEKLRGDEGGIREAAEKARGEEGGDEGEGSGRKEQSGY